MKSVAKSTDFYQQLGFPTTREGSITFMKMPNVWLSLFNIDDLAKDAGVDSHSSGFSGFTLAHNVNSPEQVDWIMEEARNIGAEITDEAHQRDWGGYSGYFSDPDGYLWEIAFNPYSPEISVDENQTNKL